MKHPKLPPHIPADFESRGKSDSLVVLLHAYTLAPDSLCHVRNVVTESWADADIFAPRLPASAFSFAEPIAIVYNLLQQVDAIWAARKKKQGAPYSRIIIVGHSLGALLGRKLYVYACGESTKAPFERDVMSKEKREWAGKVERIILLGGMNRGWSISNHMSIPGVVAYTVGTFLGELLMLVRKGSPLIFTIRCGASFLTNLRIQWLAMREQSATAGVGSALTIQLLGSVDDRVSPKDNIDLVSGADFVYLDVAKSGHKTIIDMDSSKEGLGRKEKFVLALTATRQELDRHRVLPQDTELPSKRPEVTDVIFVIHGIRDLGYWTDKIARRVQEFGKTKQRVFVTETSTYGYFPILSFLFPWRRRAKVEWLMDQYAENLAQYPNASFSYVGHSHGTYLVAKALTEYSCCRFKHVVFAGSVVRTDYRWDDLLRSGRVKAVLNYVATKDWVVAWFPNALQELNLQDLGGAGHRGFDSDVPKQIRYVKGAHSAALAEDNWDAITVFIVDGTPVSPPDDIKDTHQAWWVAIPGRFAPGVWLLIAVALVLIGTCLFPNLSFDQWWRTILFFIYLGTIYLALTRF